MRKKFESPARPLFKDILAAGVATLFIGLIGQFSKRKGKIKVNDISCCS
jgi:hypothetical protein